jgi:predicted Zn-dependent peptidase
MHKNIKLKNGINLITVPMVGTQTATMLVAIGVGSKYENRKNNGLSHFLEHMFFKGTKKRPNTLAISAELDGIGGEFNAFTSKEYTGYWVKAKADKIQSAADIISDMLINSKFDAKEIEREKGVIIEEINMYQDNPMMHIEDVFESCLYGDTAAGWDTAGSKDNIRNMKRKDFVDFFKKNYVAENTIICVAGNIQEKEIKDLSENYFNLYNQGDKNTKEKVIEKQLKPAVKIEYKKTDQAHFSFGARSFPIGHPDEYSAKLLSIILGGSMSSRLFIKLRERSGLAYFVRTHSEFYSDSGYLTTQAGVPVDKIDEAIKIILEEYQLIKKSLVSGVELKRAKDMVKGRSAIQLESSDNMANWFARQALFRDKILIPDDFFEKIDQISPQDIRNVAKKIFVQSNLNLAVIGPYKNKKIFKDSLNIVN